MPGPGTPTVVINGKQIPEEEAGVIFEKEWFEDLLEGTIGKRVCVRCDKPIKAHHCLPAGRRVAHEWQHLGGRSPVLDTTSLKP